MEMKHNGTDFLNCALKNLAFHYDNTPMQYTVFLYPATLKSAGYYVIPSVQKFAFECLSIRPSVRPSALRFHSLS